MEQPTLSESQERILREQVIDAHCPGSLLHDFQAVLDYVGTAGVKSAGKYNLLPMESLGELNDRLARPLRLQLKRPQVRSHPYLLGLNLLLRASGLGRVDGSGAKARLALDPEMVLQWEALNPTERYFNLLEAWLLVARGEMVGESGSWTWTGLLIPCLQAWQAIPARGKRIQVKNRYDLYFPGISRDFYNLALMDLFGLIAVEHPTSPVPTWSPSAIRHTAFGDALFTALRERFLLSEAAFFRLIDGDFGDEEEELEGEELESGGEEEAAEEGDLEAVREEELDDVEESIRFGRLQPLFQPYFPEWRENLELPETELREGVFVFKVSLGKVWRRIAVPSGRTLDDLVYSILKSFKFDSDHLYEFQYRNRFGGKTRVMHPYCDEGPYGSEVRVGRLPLDVGQSIELTYDFGDNWRFDVKLERIDPPDATIKAPRILEKDGQAPQQYPNWDE